MNYEQFIQQSTKTELASFIRSYGEHMSKKRKYKSPKVYYNELVSLKEVNEDDAEEAKER